MACVIPSATAMRHKLQRLLQRIRAIIHTMQQVAVQIYHSLHLFRCFLVNTRRDILCA